MWDFSLFYENTALVSDGGMRISYRELEDASRDLSRHIPGRSLVFSFCRNCPGSMIGYVSFLQHGVVPLMLNARMDREMVQHLMREYQPEYLWIPQDYAAEYPDLKTVYANWQYLLLKTAYASGAGLHPELALLLTTSGSTGSPKFVRQSYRNIESNARAITEYLKLTEKEAPVTTLPMNYTYGLSIINSHLLVGAKLLLTEGSLIQSEFWDFMKMEKASSFGGVPYTYEMLDKLKFFEMELPDLKYMTQAGGRLSPVLHRKFAEYAAQTGKKFIVMYGQCEATARMTYLPEEYALEKCGSIGIPIPGGKLILVDEHGTEITKPETQGELIYEGQNVTMGYARTRADLRLGDERYGRLATGDLAKKDAEGFFYITGRKKRFLKIYGNRVNLDEMDTMIKAEFEGLECACAGTDDQLYLFVDDGTKEEELIDFVSEKTGLNFKAFTVKVLSEIPKNEAGKVLYHELEQYYGDQAQTG